MDQIQKLMSVPEFAQTLGITASCVRRWVLERRVTTIKIGRLVKIPRQEAVRIIDAGLRPARATKQLVGKANQ